MPNARDLTAFFSRVPADGTPIGNGALREALDWDESRYVAVKEALVMQHARSVTRSVEALATAEAAVP
jgi:hypothetical protein